MTSNPPQVEQDEYVETTVVNDRLEQLKQLFPEAFRDGELDANALAEAAGVSSDGKGERYSFTWAGKREARLALQLPPRGSLVPADGESVNPDNTHNYFIEGDNLEVLKLLYKPYAGKVKMIYIDPPYNTGNDFVYPDNFAEPMLAYHQLIGQRDEAGRLTTSELDRSGHKHSTWLTMMYPRLFLARQLLREDGLIFISCDDHELQNLRMIMDEVFGEENFLTTIIWEKKYTRSNDSNGFSYNHEYIVVYARSSEEVGLRLEARTAKQIAAYSNPDKDKRGDWKSTPLHAKSGSVTGFSYTFRNGVRWTPPPGTYPRYSVDRLAQMDTNNEIWFGKDGKATPSRKTFLSDVKEGVTPVTIWTHEEAGHTHEANTELKNLMGGGTFENPKPPKLIKKMIELIIAPNDEEIVLDFFSGSSTTAQAVLELNREDGGNRRFIMVQVPEPTSNEQYPTIAEIGKERIRRAIQRMQAQRAGQLDLSDRSTTEDLGFKVFKLTDSAYKAWHKVNADNYGEQLNLYASQLADDWQPDELLWELAWREGYGLDSKIEPLAGADKLYRISDPEKAQAMVVCLANPLPANLLTPQLLAGASLFVCLDDALTDSTAANLKIQCKAFDCRFRAI